MAARLGSTKFAQVIEEIIKLTTEADSLVEFGTTSESRGGSQPYTRIGEIGDAFMPLSIESMAWQREAGAISVMHFYIQEGDLMMDPMVVITPEGEPLQYQMDGVVGHFTRFNEGERGQYKTELIAFLDTWAVNIRRIWLPMAKEKAHAAA